MASSSVLAKKSLKGLESRKSNSWWWDSHIGPRNTKWLTEHLEDMDQNYKRMLTLIEGDGDSLAKKAEMYYQKRPVLLSHVEEFYRTYKSLAERYEHLTADMKKHLLPELQSQGSAGFDSGSETTTAVGPPPDPKIGRRGLFGHRAAGFDFFLGIGKSGLDRSTTSTSRDETFSISDSETESDVSSLHSYAGLTVNNAGEEGEEKFQPQEQEYKIGSFRRSSSENFDDVHSKNAGYEEELKMALEKIHQSEEEIANLKTELYKYKEQSENVFLEGFPAAESSSSLDIDANHENINSVDVDESGLGEKYQALINELRSTKGRVQSLDKEVMKLRKENIDTTESIRKMQDLTKMAQKDAATWKAKLETEKRMATKLQDRIARYKMSLGEREKEVRELKEVLSDASRQYQLHEEISRLADEKTSLDERLRESEVHCRSLETTLNGEIELLKADIAEKKSRLEVLESDLNDNKLKYDSLLIEKDEVDNVARSKEEQIVQMQLTIAENEVTINRADEVSLRVEKLQEEVEKHKDLILEAAEGKREAIRQLCYSLEHYRNGYHQLRKTFTGHKQLHVLAS